MMTGLYRSVSTLVIVGCGLYMCLVSMLHFDQARDWQSHSQTDHQHMQQQTNTQGDKKASISQGFLHKYLLSRSILQTHQRKHPNKSSPLEMNASRIGTSPSGIGMTTFNIGNATFGEDNSRTSPQLTMRKLNEKATQHATNINQEVASITASSPDVHIPQISVNFLFLRGVYVYGIYLDKRYPKGQFIRILALQPASNLTTQLMCQFHDALNRRIDVKAEPYEMCENHGKKYGGWIYSCLVPHPGGATLKSVSLLAVTEDWTVLDRLEPLLLRSLNLLAKRDERLPQSMDSNSNRQMSTKFDNISQTSITNSPQTKHIRDKNNLRLGVCVPPLHGDISLSKIISFIEMCRLLGADQVFLYVHDIPMDILAFLRNYTGLNPHILSLVLWDLPMLDKDAHTGADQTVWNRGQLPAIQHCLYTNMLQFDWLLFIDIDEMLIPQTSTTWPELMSEVTSQFSPQFQTGSIAGISFESAFFQQDFQAQVTNPIGYFQSLHRTRETSVQRSKLLVRPSQVFELGIHHLSRGVVKDSTVVKIRPDQALLHHYRKCVSDYNTVNALHCEILVKDDTILRYEVPLTVASREVTANAMEFFVRYS